MCSQFMMHGQKNIRLSWNVGNEWTLYTA